MRARFITLAVVVGLCGFPVSVSACPNGKALRGLEAFQIRVRRDTTRDEYYNRFPDGDAVERATAAEQARLSRAAAAQLRKAGIKGLVDSKTAIRLPVLVISYWDHGAKARLWEEVTARRAHAQTIPATTWEENVDEGDCAEDVVKYAVYHFISAYKAGEMGFDGP